MTTRSLLFGCLALFLAGCTTYDSLRHGDSGDSKRRGLEARALEVAGERLGCSPEELEITQTATASLRHLDREVFRFKVLRPGEGAVTTVSLSAAGEEVPFDELYQADKAHEREQYGNFSPALADAVEADPEASLAVVMWIAMPPQEPFARPEVDRSLSVGDVESQIEDLIGHHQQQLAPRLEAMAERLAPLAEDLSVDALVPMISATMSAQNLQEIRDWEEIDRIYLDETPTVLLLEKARVATRVNPVIRRTDSAGRPLLGGGVKVASIEFAGLVNAQNPHLKGGVPLIQDRRYWRGLSPSEHATEVVGAIRSTHLKDLGYASAVTLYTGGQRGSMSPDSETRKAVENVIKQKARIVNLSWGKAPPARGETHHAMEATSRFFDEIVHRYYTTVVAGAGNEGSGFHNSFQRLFDRTLNDTPYVLEPATAYNVLAVGASERAATGFDVWSGSSFVDPRSTNGDREKPEIMAPGEIQTTLAKKDGSRWMDREGPGTSLASPVVAGSVALMQQRIPILAFWPEISKAVLLASAIDNQEGASRLSERDGAGGLQNDTADKILTGVEGGWWGTRLTCRPGEKTRFRKLYLDHGQKVRIAIVWDSDPGDGDYQRRPSSDLDLWIVDASGRIAHRSTSFDNPYEIVEFTPKVSQHYEVIIRTHRCSGRPARWLGLAWWQEPPTPRGGTTRTPVP